jgi:queuine/archaeosine tRNA-ribosyltransferase
LQLAWSPIDELSCVLKPFYSHMTNVISRKNSIPISGLSVNLPIFFPSISSIKTNLPIEEYLKILDVTNQPSFLISSYDICKYSNEQQKTIIRDILAKAVASKRIVAIDSGNYESFWLKDSRWEDANFWECLGLYKYGIAFSFDKKLHSFVNSTAQVIVKEIETGVLKDQEKAKIGAIIPIIHATSDLIPEIACKIAFKLHPVMIAIPERELGEGLLQRVVTLKKIRQSLNKTGEYFPIHLLGTGNPLSILLYVFHGADSFDGLEWCQTAVNFDNALLYHFQQRELFGYQSKYDTLNIPYTQATLAHNLEFYLVWMNQIREKIQSGSIIDLINKYFKKDFISLLSLKLNEVIIE